MQDRLQEHRKDDVKFRRAYDLPVFKAIAKESGSAILEKETGYLDRAKFFGGKQFVSEMLGDFAFYAGTIGKKHFRLIEIAVKQSEQGKGYGRLMMFRIIALCRKRGLNKITLRTNRTENAVNFYKRFGGEITGIKGEDYEMEILI